jgi:L-amino acid N-acyltransferase YncA
VKDQKVGVVRYDPIGADCYDVSININPAMRGQGWGTQLLKQSLSQVKGKILARIRQGNTASLKLFKRIGCKLVKENNGVLEFELKVD